MKGGKRQISNGMIASPERPLPMICVYTCIKSKAHRGVEVWLHSSLTTALVSGEQIRIKSKPT